jgi:hypothetical protein
MKSSKSGWVYRKFRISNENDNYLQIKSNDRVIELKLCLENYKPRLIGTVTKSTRTIEMKRKRAKHLHRKTNSYGFNDYVLRNQTSIDWVRLSDDCGYHWKIPVDYILEKGTYLHFKQDGFELQRFVSLENLEQFRVREEENTRF